MGVSEMGSKISMREMGKKKDFDYVPLNEAQKAKFDGTTVGKDKDGLFLRYNLLGFHEKIFKIFHPFLF